MARQIPKDRLNLSVNKFSNVRRDIIRNERLKDSELANIRDSIRRNSLSTNTEVPINYDAVEATAIGKQERQLENNTADPAVKVQEQTQTAQDRDGNERVTELMTSIQQRWETIRGTPIIDRRPIPKIKKDHNCKVAIGFASEAVQHIKYRIANVMDLTEINYLIYATASVIAD